MKKPKRRSKMPHAATRGPARKPQPLTRRQLGTLRFIAGLGIATGVMLLIKVVTTLVEGTAWDDLSVSSRQAQPVEFWSFVVTYLGMGGFMAWLGVSLWPSRREAGPVRSAGARRER